MDHYEPVDPASGDDACDAKEAGCGEDAGCAIENDEPTCYCEGRGSVPKGAACKSVKASEKQVNENLRQKGNVGSEEGSHRELIFATLHAAVASTMETSGIRETRCTDYGNWRDSYGDGCSWYETWEYPGCPLFGNDYEAFDSAGVSLGKPNFACCHCNGGCEYTRFFYESSLLEPECTFADDDPEKFTIAFVSDMENQYRNHHDEWCGEIAEHIRTLGSRGYNYPSGARVQNPSLVIHGGDISDSANGWWGGNLRNDNAIWDTTYQRFYDANIPFISILGNHDELNTNDAPSSAKSEATEFVRRTFTRSAATSSDFTYEEVQVSGAHHPYYAVDFRGVQIATINNAYEGINDRFRQAFDTSKPIISFSHFGLHRTSHTNIQEYKDFLATFPKPYNFAGHAHMYDNRPPTAEGIKEYIAPYPHPNAHDYSLGTGYLAIEVSPSQGVIQVKLIEYDYQSVTGCLGSGELCFSNINCNRCCPSIGDTCDMAGCACGNQGPGDMLVESMIPGESIVDWFLGWSDRRLKHNVKQIGTSDMGIPIYTFNYHEGVKDLANGAGMDTESTFQGVMAQDLLELKPDAVVLGSDGYYRVNYSEIDVEFHKMN